MEILRGKDKRTKEGKFVPNEYFYNRRMNVDHLCYGKILVI